MPLIPLKYLNAPPWKKTIQGLPRMAISLNCADMLEPAHFAWLQKGSSFGMHWHAQLERCQVDPSLQLM